MKTAFIELMTDHWENSVGLASSEPLQQGWRQLETACKETSSGQKPWQVLRLPTGSGKTEALKAFCASYGREGQTGILVVTRFKKGADDLAAGINALAGAEIAISQHSGNTVKIDESSNMPVLIITHSAYKSALSEAASCDISPQLDRYRQYVHTDRRMVVVDEAFDWVESFKIDLSELQAFCGALSGVPGLIGEKAFSAQQWLDALAETAQGSACTNPAPIGAVQVEPPQLPRASRARGGGGRQVPPRSGRPPQRRGCL